MAGKKGVRKPQPTASIGKAAKQPAGWRGQTGPGNSRIQPSPSPALPGPFGRGRKGK